MFITFCSCFSLVLDLEVLRWAPWRIRIWKLLFLVLWWFLSFLHKANSFILWYVIVVYLGIWLHCFLVSLLISSCLLFICRANLCGTPPKISPRSISLEKTSPGAASRKHSLKTSPRYSEPTVSSLNLAATKPSKDTSPNIRRSPLPVVRKSWSLDYSIYTKLS